jgi:hypothetical protein
MNKKEIEELKEELEFYRQHTKLSLCKYCKKPIINTQNKVTVVLRVRNKKVKHYWQGRAYTNRNIGTYHEMCFKKKNPTIR